MGAHGPFKLRQQLILVTRWSRGDSPRDPHHRDIEFGLERDKKRSPRRHLNRELD